MYEQSPWQKRCVKDYSVSLDKGQKHFTIVAGTGSGKTHAGSDCAVDAFSRHTKENPYLVVMCPSRNVKRAWKKVFSSKGLQITSNNNRVFDPDLDGCAITFHSAVNLLDALTELGRPFIIVIDEFHHLEAQGTWAKPLRELVPDQYLQTISLSGTPWHEEGDLLEPFIQYIEVKVPDSQGNETVQHKVMGDVYYPYGKAINEEEEWRNVVPVIFHENHAVAYSDVISNETDKIVNKLEIDTHTMARGDSISPFVDFLDDISSYDGVTATLDRAIDCLESERMYDQQPTAGGLIICMGIGQAKAVKSYLAQDPINIEAQIVHSEEPRAQSTILDFDSDGSAKWIITVDMITEGVDIPRLKVLVDLTNKMTLLSIIQRWGRVLRRLRKKSNPKEFMPNGQAHIFFIAHPRLVEVAKAIQDEVEVYKRAKKVPGTPPPEAKNHRVTTGQDHTEEKLVTMGDDVEVEVMSLAKWMWEVDYQSVRAGRRAYVDALTLSRMLISEGVLPSGYERPVAPESPEQEKMDYDTQVERLVSYNTKIAQEIARKVRNGNESKDAMTESMRWVYSEVNRAMGVLSWNSKKQPRNVLIARMRASDAVASQHRIPVQQWKVKMLNGVKYED